MSSRRACTGAIREVRQAGSQAAAMVTRRRRRTTPATVRGSEDQRLPGQVEPELPNSRRSGIASSTPSPEPDRRAEQAEDERLKQDRPRDLAREAPSARSRASSRLRWATRIEKVLTIRNAADDQGDPAKISRNVVMKEIASSRSGGLVRGLVAGDGLDAVGQHLAATLAGSSWLTPSSAVTQRSL